MILTLAAPVRSVAVAQNLPPVAVVDALTTELTVGADAILSAARSFDPDGGPSPLGFAWDFDDGTVAAGPEVRHAFATPGAYRVRVTVDDGEARSEAGVTLHVLALPTDIPAAGSSPLLCDGATAWVTSAIASVVSSVDLGRRAILWSVPLPGASDVARGPDGALWVLGDGRVHVLDPGTGETLRVVDVDPFATGLLVAPRGRRVVISVEPRSEVIVLDAALAPLARLSVGGDPRGLAADERAAWVASFLTREPSTAGALTEILLEAPAIGRRVALALDESPDTASSGGGVPNLLGALAISPSGETLWVGGLKSSRRGLARDGQALTPENRVRGLLAPVRVEDGVDDGTGRIDTNDAGQVSAIAFSPTGRFLYAAHPGIGAVSVYDLPAAALFTGAEPGSTVPFAARVEVGGTPDALAMALDGRLVVRLREASALAVVDVRDPAAPVLEATIPFADDPRPPAVARGARLFHSSRAPVHSRGGYVSCAACHPGGGMDGRTWDFTQSGEGLRSTIDLRGKAGLGHGPLHWSANFDEVQDFENDIVLAFGGTGLAMDGAGPHPPLDGPANAGRSEALDALAAYVTSLATAPRSPHHDALDPAASRGRALFFDREVGCAACHVPPRFTDSSLDVPYRLHDVGTLRETSGARLGGPLRGLDTPSLLGVWASAPYLHDGRARDLRDVLTTENPDDRHGRTSHLDDEQLDDLVAYLRSLDERERGASAEAGCAVQRDGSSGGLAALGALLALAFATRRSRRRSRGKM